MESPTKAGINAVGKLWNKVSTSFQEAKLAKDQEKTTIEAASSFQFLGVNNHNLQRKPEDYAQSPLISHIKKNFGRPGIVYVAYVPNSKGKTTACYACLDKPYTRKGIAFSPEVGHNESYFASIVESLGFDVQDPPDGFMGRLLEELGKDDGCKMEATRKLMILDNFMQLGCDDIDLHFLHKLKAYTRESVITVIVLTSNRNAACRLLSQNQLRTIVPMVTPQQLVDLRRANPAETINPDLPLAFDWEQELSMTWDKEELKKALFQTSAFLGLQRADQGTIRQDFDSVFNGLSPEDKADADPCNILDSLPGAQRRIATTPTATTVPSSTATAGDDGGCCCTISWFPWRNELVNHCASSDSHQ